ncbi:PilZ domain-containing protein [Pseudomonas oligotrophica]|uniref:PilZ domain-containing protein n=1 Tax=Pseudomonas oligotrophica TaxID=2912055 RepID=UPI001F304A29|nr:PilZ domain-containing protein [Pseudomonas oligotrophica]MCF7202274.1 PilZ domain-containing protein [Pseudomonas oligotrophica]
MPTQDTEERREYYRIEDRVALEILPAEAHGNNEPPALPRQFSLLADLHLLDFESQHLLRQIAEHNRTLASYLKVQNKRMDLLGQALVQGLLAGMGPERSVTLSEGGVSFVHDRALAEGTQVLLKMVLLPQGLGLLLPARIGRCDPQAGGGYEVATEFEALTEAQRQLLARHILQKQALERRLAREHLQGD